MYTNNFLNVNKSGAEISYPHLRAWSSQWTSGSKLWLVKKYPFFTVVRNPRLLIVGLIHSFGDYWGWKLIIKEVTGKVVKVTLKVVKITTFIASKFNANIWLIFNEVWMTCELHLLTVSKIWSFKNPLDIKAF